MRSFNKFSCTEINKMKALYCDEYVPIRVNYFNIYEYWNNLSIVDKEQLLVVDDTTIIQGFNEIFTTVFNQYPELENKTKLVSQENQECYLEILQTDSINGMIQNSDIQILLQLFVVIQNNVCKTKKEDELEDAELADIADYNILKGKEKLIKVKTPLINNVFETFKYYIADFCRGEKNLIKQTHYSQLYEMINKNSINDDINNTKNIMEKKLADLCQLLSVLFENNIISQYMKIKEPEQPTQEFEGFQYYNQNTNKLKNLKSFVIKVQKITEMNYDTDSSQLYDSEDETTTNDTDEILNQQKDSEDQLLEIALSGKKNSDKDNSRKFSSPSSNKQNPQVQEFHPDSQQYFNPYYMMQYPGMYFPQDFGNYDYYNFQMPQYRMNNNNNYNYNNKQDYKRNNKNYQESYQQDYQDHRDYNSRDGNRKKYDSKNSLDNRKYGGYREYNYRSNKTYYEEKDYYNKNNDQDQDIGSTYKRKSNNVSDKVNNSYNSRNKGYTVKSNQYKYEKKSRYERNSKARDAYDY